MRTPRFAPTASTRLVAAARRRVPRARQWRRRRFLPVLAGGAVLASAFLVAPSGARAADTQPSHFIQTATAANSTGDFTLITNGATNGNPNALVFVTPNFDPGQSCPCINYTATVGAYYDPANGGQWAIFHEDQSAMAAGESFNVLVVPSAGRSAFTVTARPSTIHGNRLVLDSPAANGSPSRELLVTQNWDPGGVGGVFNNSSVGVSYTGSQWAIFNEGEDAMPVGASFNVLVGAVGGGTGSTVQAKVKNTEGAVVRLHSVVTEGDSNAFALETPNWNPKGIGGTSDTSPTAMYGQQGLWYVLNESLTPMPRHAAFNVLAWNS